MSDSKSAEIILKETRQAKGIPIEAVHEATKIPLDVLKAIEEGYTVRALSSPFYRKQFLKMYANFLGIELKNMAFVEPPKEEKKPLPFPKLPRYQVEPKFETPAKGIVLTKQQKQQIVLAVGALLVIFLVGKAVGFVAGKISKFRSSKKQVVKVKDQKSRPSKKKPAAVKPKVKKEEVKKEEAKKEEIKKEEPEKENSPIPVVPVPAVVEKAPEVKPIDPEPRFATPVVTSPESGKIVNLTVRAKKKSWLQVKVDGVTVFQSSLQKGAVENWQADEKIELVGNNILFLEFEVNGKMVGTLGRMDGRARKLIVTKDGLSVKK